MDFITLKRDGCYGTCPSYSVTVYSDGSVEFIGEQFVRVVGKQTYKISKDSAVYLFRKAEQIGFYSFKSEYREAKEIRKNEQGTFDTLTVMVTDLPTYTVTIRNGNLAKSVVDYFRSYSGNQELKKYEAPEILREFEKEIDRVTGTINLVK